MKTFKVKPQHLAIRIFGLLVLAVLLSRVFSGNIILPQGFNLGPLYIRYYGLTLALAVISAYVLLEQTRHWYKVTTEESEVLLLYLVVGGFIGARLYHVLSDIGYYVQHVGQIFAVWQGGLSIYGAVLGGLFALWLASKWSRKISKSVLVYLDWLTPGLILGQIIGRFGNLFNYEAFGYPTNLPWRMFVPESFRPADFANFAFFHPFFLYEALANSIILGLLLMLAKRSKQKSGRLFLLYVLLYNAVRFFLEFLRIDSTFIFGHLRLNALVSAILVLLAGALILYQGQHESKNA